MPYVYAQRPCPSACLSVRPSVCDLVSATKLTASFIKFGTGVLYRKLSCKLEFHANHLHERHTVLKSITEFLHMLSIFLD
jgi:hypothetical protein